MYTVISKFQQSKPTDNDQVIKHNKLEQLLRQRNFECADHKFSEATQRNFQLIEQKCEPSQQTNQINEQKCEPIERNLQGGQYKFQSNEHNLQLNGHNLQSTDRKIQQVQYNVQSTDRKTQQVKFNVQSTEHNQHIEHKSGYHNMKTVNKLEMGSYKQTNNVGPYGRQKRSCNKNSFNYLGSKKSNQLNV